MGPMFKTGPRRDGQGVALMILASALWATVGLADGGISAHAIETEVTGFVRTALGAFVLGLLALALGLPLRARAQAQGWPVTSVAVFGLCCALFQIALFKAFHHVGVSVTVAVTVCLPPILLACGEGLRRAAMPCPAIIVAALVAVVGVVLVQLLPGRAMGPTSVDPRGAALLLIASLAFCGMTLASRRMVVRLSCIWATAAGLGMAAVLLLGVIALRDDASVAQILLLDGRDLALVAYIGVVATGGAYLAFFGGLQRAASAAAALVATMTEPVFAVLLAAAILGERLTPSQMVGVVLLLLAMALLTRQGPRHLVVIQGSKGAEKHR
jgi:drug/metabolite transporter, DME family